MSFGNLILSFDFAQDGEHVEPFRISNFVLRIFPYLDSRDDVQSFFDCILSDGFNFLRIWLAVYLGA